VIDNIDGLQFVKDHHSVDDSLMSPHLAVYLRLAVSGPFRTSNAESFLIRNT
jgi:hypothetical protein